MPSTSSVSSAPPPAPAPAPQRAQKVERPPEPPKQVEKAPAPPPQRLAESGSVGRNLNEVA